MKLLPAFRFFRYLLQEAIPFIILTLLILTVLILAQQVARQSDILFNSSASILLSFRIIFFLLPGILVITLPFSLLIGSLMALNRLSSDNEIIAARASGLNLLQIASPLVCLGLAGTVLSAFLTVSVIPSLFTLIKGIRAELLIALISAPIKAQTFNIQFPGHLVFTREIDPTTGDWLSVFIIRNLGQDQTLLLTAKRGRLRLTQTTPLTLEIDLSEGMLLTFSNSEPQKQSLTSFQQQEIKLSSENSVIVQAIDKGRSAQELSMNQLSTRSLTTTSEEERRQSQVEWHKRFSLPFSCIILTILAIPLGLTTSRQTGRAVAFTIGFTIAVLYYLTLIAGQNLALAGTLPAGFGLWLPNLLGLLFALLRSFSWSPRRAKPSLTANLLFPVKTMLTFGESSQATPSSRRPIFLSIVNYLLLSELIKYFAISLAILLITSLVFTLLDILPSLNKSGLGWQYASIYLLFLSPQIAYYVTPFAILLAVLTAHSVLSRSNQITALLTTGHSTARLIWPLVLFIFSIITTSLWASETLLPYANREQDSRYNRIKGKKDEQSVLALGRHWVRGEDGTIFGFQINNTNNILLNTTAYRVNDLDGKLSSILQAQEAVAINDTTWQIMQGWQYKIDSQHQLNFQMLPLNSANHPDNYLNIPQGVSLFRRLVNEAAKMTFQDLRTYIRQLSRLGVATTSLRVELEKKLAFPFSSIPLIILAFPLAFKSSRRGTLAGVGLSIIIGFTFWITASFMEGLGKQSYLPPGLSIWGTQALFLTLGFFLIFRLRK